MNNLMMVTLDKGDMETIIYCLTSMQLMIQQAKLTGSGDDYGLPITLTHLNDIIGELQNSLRGNQ